MVVKINELKIIVVQNNLKILSKNTMKMQDPINIPNKVSHEHNPPSKITSSHSDQHTNELIFPKKTPLFEIPCLFDTFSTQINKSSLKDLLRKCKILFSGRVKFLCVKRQRLMYVTHQRLYRYFMMILVT